MTMLYSVAARFGFGNRPAAVPVVKEHAPVLQVPVSNEDTRVIDGPVRPSNVAIAKANAARLARRDHNFPTHDA
jgi:hypothetical protein